MSGNLLARSLHDLSAAAWFGGSLMGAIGLNGAAAAAKDPVERARLSSIGWGKWAPVQAAAFGAHVIGGLGLILGNKGRLGTQDGVASDTVVKTAVTLAGIGLTVYSGMLGKKVYEHASEGAEGATEPRHSASPEMESAQKQLKILQWSLPAVSALVIILGARQGEMQRPKNIFEGLRKH